eukprot:1146519-Pelagomonas_calceolata.AAC.2
MSRIGKDACPAASGMAPFLVDQLHWHTFSLAQPNTSCPSAMCTYSLDCGNGKDASWVALECGHVFHMECVAQALEHQRTCPTCRVLLGLLLWLRLHNWSAAPSPCSLKAIHCHACRAHSYRAKTDGSCHKPGCLQ